MDADEEGFIPGLYFREDNNMVKDRREHIDWSKAHSSLSSFESNVQLSFTVNGVKNSGSGTIVVRNGSSFVITAAHNLVSKDGFTNQRIVHKDLIAFKRRNGGDVYESKRCVVASRVHEGYNSHPNCGFDIAVCKLSEDLGESNYNRNYFSFAPLVFDNFRGSVPLD